MNSNLSKILSTLRPHQRTPFNTLNGIFEQHQSALDASDTGTGKTAVACAIAASLAVPTLAIVPKISVSSWLAMAELFGEPISAVGYEKLRAGNTEFGSWENNATRRVRYLQCSHCQLRITDTSPACYTRPDGVHCVETKSRAAKRGKFSFHPGIKLLILDEVHRCSAMDSLNADLLLAAKRQNIKTLMLSATLASDPMHLRAIGYNLDLFKLPEYNAWMAQRGVRWDKTFGGFHWPLGEEKQRMIMGNIRDSIIPARGIRVTTASIPGFPERHISADQYDLDNWSEVNDCYSTMQSSLEELKRRQSEDKSPEHPLTQLLRARQKVELLKVPIVLELVFDALEKGFSVGVFVNFKATLEALQESLVGACVIQGGQKIKDREESIARFQSNESRAILINSEAGGVSVSLQDLTGGHPRMGFIMPGQSATTFRQVLGRFHRDGGRSTCFYKVIFAAKTVEVSMLRALNQKLHCLDSLNDSDLLP